MTRNALFLSLITLIVASSAFGHAGEIHSYMGTITATGDTFTMKTTDGDEVSFVTSAKTSYRFSDNAPAKRSDIATGSRVVVVISKDGRTASSIKIARNRKT